MKRFFLAGIAASIMVLSACNNNDNQDDTEKTRSTPIISYNIVAAFPHDTSSFTEGLEFYNNSLLESTGNYKYSKLLQVDLQTGKAVKEVKLEDQYFGEGISVLHDTLYQMTYKEHVVFVYDVKTFNKIKELPLKTEGWGMTNDGKQLIVSDGSSNLFFYEPGTFRLLRTQEVTENGTPAVNINELEFIDGYVYANQWQYNYILKIDPNTGEVAGKIDLTDLVNQVKAKDPKSQELNGIARNPATGKIYVTGKNWPELFEISLSPAAAQ
jgi:glutaminyl-peptide cyclotransferase